MIHPFQRLDDKFYNNKLYQWYYQHIWLNICHYLWWNPKNFFHNIRLFFERGRKGYTHEDWWSIRDWLIDNLAPQLEYWSEHANSCPDDVPGIKGSEEWEKFLKDSANAFKEYRDIDEGDDPYALLPETKEKYNKCRKQIKKFFHVLGNEFDTFWD